MMKQLVVILILVYVNSHINAQSDSLTLLQCMSAARSQAKLRPQIETYNEIAALEIEGRRATNLPSLSAFGKAWYQSDAITAVTPLGPGLEIDRFQYNFGLEAKQKIYDGGIARKGRDLDETSINAEISKVETELYQLNDLVVDFFFKSLLLNNNKEVIRLKQTILKKRLAELESAYRNGMISENEVGKIRAELLSTDQKIMEIEKYREQTNGAIEILTGIKIDTGTTLVMSDTIAQFATDMRPEHTYFDTEMLKLDKMAGLNSARNLPKFYVFGQTGYSYPGLNFFENKSDYYYIIGATMSWTIFDWNENKRKTQVIHKQKEIINSSRDNFDQKLELSSRNEEIEQEKLLKLIGLDEQIIEQRTQVRAGSASALENGTITTGTYLEDLNAEIIARIELETHRIQYQNSLARSYLIGGIDINAYTMNMDQ